MIVVPKRCISKSFAFPSFTSYSPNYTLSSAFPIRLLILFIVSYFSSFPASFRRQFSPNSLSATTSTTSVLTQ